MRNQPSIALANDKRMEVLLRKEMMEHQAIISSHHKEMEALRESLKMLCKSLMRFMMIVKKKLI